MVFGEINAGFTLVENIKKLFKKPEATVASRFVQLFEKHGVHRNQIPRFLGHGLTVATVADDTTLLPALTEEILNAACELFAVRREWLDGVDTQIYPLHDFYKCPEEFSAFILNLKNKAAGRLGGMVFISDSSSRENDDTILVLEEEIGMIGDKNIYRYYICNNWLFNYWKSRVYLAACISLAHKNSVFIYGRKLPFDKIEKYLEGERFLGNHYDGLIMRAERCYPEDMSCSPKILFEGLQGQLHSGEYEATIELWLELANKGMMDTCFNPAPIEKFKEVLHKPIIN